MYTSSELELVGSVHAELTDLVNRRPLGNRRDVLCKHVSKFAVIGMPLFLHSDPHDNYRVPVVNYAVHTMPNSTV